MTEPNPQSDPFALVGTVVADRFRIDREIAEGGFGVVYLGTQVALDRPVAIKVLKSPPGFDEAARIQFREKFAAEAKTIARLKHSHIVDVYDFGISTMPSGGLAPWMALEWLDGETLEATLEKRRGRGNKMTPVDVLALLRPALQAIGYAHRQGIAHRDIKPANIMVTQTDHGPVLRVLDFGIAKIMNAAESAGTGRTKTSGMPAFSPPYAAPEQVTFARTGPWTDVHALGLVLIEALTGERAFTADDMQLYEQIMAPERPTPRMKGHDVGGWEPVLAKAVAIQPTQRWKDANELLAALEAAVKDTGGAAKAAIPPRGLELDDTALPAAAAAPRAAAPEAGRGGGRWIAVAGAVLAVVGIVATAIVLAGRDAPKPAPAAAETAVAPPSVTPPPAAVPSPAAPVPGPPAPSVAAPAVAAPVPPISPPRAKRAAPKRKAAQDKIEIE